MRGVMVAGSVLLASCLAGAVPSSARADEVLATVGDKSFTRSDIETREKAKLIEI